MIRGVFFDLDDTLVGYDAANRGALAAAWREEFGERQPVDAQALEEAARDVYLARFGYGTPGFATLGRLSVEALTCEIAAGALRKLGIEADPDALARIWSEVGLRLLQALPGAAATIDRLRAAGKILGLITNGPGSLQRAKLAAVSLAEAFDAIVIDTEFGHPKPDRRIFDHAASAAGLPPAELMFVGNSLEADVAGAKESGWTAVWYNPGGEVPPAEAAPDYVIASLAEVVSIVDTGRVE
jgi:putative hydrolase of the HAD superfamily